MFVSLNLSNGSMDSVMTTQGLAIHFISGLPRSGSTLLSAILRQNPRFSAGMSGPVATLVNGVLPKMSGAGEYASFFNDERRHRVLRSLFEAYHHEAFAGGQLVFDTNRTWTAKLSLLNALFPDAKVICCVRDVPWVIDSVEKMVRRNPTHVSGIFYGKDTRNVYGRVKDVMDSERGLIGLPWGSLREAWFGEHASKLIVVRYESLVTDPVNIVSDIYRQLGMQPFSHDFDNIEYAEERFDQQLGMPDLHTVRRKVELERRNTILPPDIFMKYTDMNFWDNEKLNAKKVCVL
jgi:sulfotransferase